MGLPLSAHCPPSSPQLHYPPSFPLLFTMRKQKSSKEIKLRSQKAKGKIKEMGDVTRKKHKDVGGQSCRLGKREVAKR